MAPEERAAMILPPGYSTAINPAYGDELREEISQAIREAVFDEREACAKVVDEAINTCILPKELAGWVTKAIRARSNP